MDADGAEAMHIAEATVIVHWEKKLLFARFGGCGCRSNLVYFNMFVVVLLCFQPDFGFMLDSYKIFKKTQ